MCSNETGLPMLNLTAEEHAELYLLRGGAGGRMLAVLYATLAVGLPANLAFLLVLVRVPHMRTATNVFLSSLAAFDLMLLVSCVASYSAYYGQPVRSHLATAAALGCLGAFMPQYFTYFASLVMLTLVSLDRYAVICSPHPGRGRGNTRCRDGGVRRNVGLVLAGSALALGLAALVMPRFARLRRYCAVWPAGEPYADLPVLLGFCQPTSRLALIVGHLLESAVFAVALVVNGACYGAIIAYLHRRVAGRRRRPASQASVDSTLAQRALQVRNQVALMLLAHCAVFFLCQAPFVVVSLCTLADQLSGLPAVESHRRWAGPLTVTHSFLYWNAAVNPIVYNVASRHYRQAFAQAFCWPGPRRRTVRAVADGKKVLETLPLK